LVFPDKEVFLGLMEPREEEVILDLLDLRAMLENKAREDLRELLAHLALQEKLGAQVIQGLLELLVKWEPLV